MLVTWLHYNNNQISLCEGGGVGKEGASINQSINQLYLNTVNGSASWLSDMLCNNTIYKN